MPTHISCIQNIIHEKWGAQWSMVLTLKMMVKSKFKLFLEQFLEFTGQSGRPIQTFLSKIGLNWLC